MLERKERFFCWSAKGSWAVWSSCGVPGILFNTFCGTGAGISNSKNYDVNGVCFDHLHSDDQDIRNKSIYNRGSLFGLGGLNMQSNNVKSMIIAQILIMICCILRKNVKIQIGIIHIITITIIIVIVTIHIITSSASASRGSLLLSVLTWGGGKWYRVANIPWLTFIIIHFQIRSSKLWFQDSFALLQEADDAQVD